MLTHYSCLHTQLQRKAYVSLETDPDWSCDVTAGCGLTLWSLDNLADLESLDTPWLIATQSILLTDVQGVKDAEGDVITRLTADHVRELTENGVIAGGMIPKTETALDAIDQGVGAVVIMDGRAPHAILLELFTQHGAGSMNLA